MNNDQEVKNIFKKIENHNITDYSPINNFVGKKVITKGYGKKCPQDGDEMYVHYIGELKNDGRSVDNTYLAKEPHCFILGNNSITYGLELGIKTMTIGEKAYILVEPEYGHLPLENFKNNLSNVKYLESALTIDFDTKSLEINEAKKYLPIIYEVELLYFDKPRKSKNEMSTIEKIETATELKSLGINSFKDNSFKEAEKHFEVALDYLTKIPSKDMNDILDLKLSLILNVCNCLINLNEYANALRKIEQAFQIKVNAKCYYYRALARMHMAEFQNAEKDIEKLSDYLPGDPTIKNLRTKLSNLKEEYNKKTSSLVKKSINSLYDDKDEQVKSVFPPPNKDNKCFYLDFIKNDDTKNPLKLKFEIFNEKWADALINAISSNNKKVEIIKSSVCKDKLILSLGNFTYELFKNIFLDIDMIRAKITYSSYDEHSRQALFHERSIFPPNQSGLICVQKEQIYEIEDVEFEVKVIITITEISDLVMENVYVLGRCYYNLEFIKKLEQNDKLSLISQGILLNIV